jgi:hypothetical protein
MTQLNTLMSSAIMLGLFFSFSSHAKVESSTEDFIYFSINREDGAGSLVFVQPSRIPRGSLLKDDKKEIDEKEAFWKAAADKALDLDTIFANE